MVSSDKQYEMPRRDPNKIKTMFDAISIRYDLLNYLMSFGMDKGWRKKLVKEADLKPGFKIMDLACGTGDITLAFYEALPEGATVQGTDFAPEMIQLARKKALNRKIDTVKFEVGDALHIEAKDASKDVLSIGFALRNLADLPKAFQEMSRVLKPEGKLLCLDLTRPENPVMKFGHAIFLKTYVPIMGFIFSGDFKAYQYLAKSIREFPPPPIILKAMQDNGFKKVRAVRLSGGIATIFIGEK